MQESTDSFEFTERLEGAKVFRTKTDAALAPKIAKIVKGEVVSLQEAEIQERLSEDEYAIPEVPSIPLTNPEPWFDKYLPYILNCTGPQMLMLTEYQRWTAAVGYDYDVTERMGLPAVLSVGAYTNINEPRAGHFTFAFTLLTIGELTPEQAKAWNKLPYGILLTDGRRVLIPTLNVSSRVAFEVVRGVRGGRASIKTTEERTALMKQYAEECRQAARKDSKSASIIQTMKLK